MYLCMHLYSKCSAFNGSSNDILTFSTLWANSADDDDIVRNTFLRKQDLTCHAICLNLRQFA